MAGVNAAVGTFRWANIRSKLARRVATAFQMFTGGPMVRPSGPLSAFVLPFDDRISFVEHFLRPPTVNASVGVANNLDFEILGTGASDGDATIDAEGGTKLETDASANQQVILLPHLDSGQSAWTGVTWGTDREVWWAAGIKIGAAAPDIVWAGLKLTNTATVATDADQAFFRAAASENIKAVYSIGGVDTEVDTGVALAAATVYDLRIVIDADRLAHFFINGALVASSTALTDTIDLIPYVGVQGNAKSITVRHMAISRNAA
jgi:hypothetical protein